MGSFYIERGKIVRPVPLVHSRSPMDLYRGTICLMT
jgi:hypothetical protein